MQVKPLIALVSLAGASLAHAGPTALLQIPIADILGHRETMFEFETNGAGKIYSFDHSLQVGLFDIGEFGYDNDLLGHTTWNAKVQLYHTKDASKFAVSFGVRNIGLSGVQPDKYLVARYDLKEVRLHAGFLYGTQGKVLLGVDGPLPKGFSYAVDYMGGDSAYVFGGINIPLPLPGFLLALTYGLPTDAHNPTQHQINLYYDFRF